MKPIFRLTDIIALLLICVAVQAQRRNSRYNEYIKQYPDQAVETLAIAARNERGEFLEEPIPPCGACRQVMLETEKRFKRPMRILLSGEKGIYELRSVGALLPLSFDASSML